MSLLGRWLGSDTMASTVEVDVATAYRLQQKGAQLIDVREPHEFKSGHAKGARNIPLLEIGNHIREFNAGSTVLLLICRDGNRSRMAQDLLRRRNCIETCNVRGGTRAWEDAGLPTK